MKRKNNLLLLLILLCSIINNVFITTMVAAENETQSPEEIARIQAENKEYDRTHPKPKTPPPPLTSSWREISTDGQSMSIGTVRADNEMVVYKEKKSNIYHMGYCKYYEEKSGGDYSNPQWLANIVMHGTRCTLCIPDEVYHTYKEAVYRQKLNQQEYWINPMKKIIIILIVIYILSVIAFVAYLIRKRWSDKIISQISAQYFEHCNREADYPVEEVEIEYSDFIKEVGVQRDVIYKFKCPKCGGVAQGVLSTYNGHIHIHCTECGLTIME